MTAGSAGGGNDVMVKLIPTVVKVGRGTVGQILSWRTSAEPREMFSKRKLWDCTSTSSIPSIFSPMPATPASPGEGCKSISHKHCKDNITITFSPDHLQSAVTRFPAAGSPVMTSACIYISLSSAERKQQKEPRFQGYPCLQPIFLSSWG